MTSRWWCELRQEFHVLASGGLHFTPAGVSTPDARNYKRIMKGRPSQSSLEL